VINLSANIKYRKYPRLIQEALNQTVGCLDPCENCLTYFTPTGQKIFKCAIPDSSGTLIIIFCIIAGFLILSLIAIILIIKNKRREIILSKARVVESRINTDVIASQKHSLGKSDNLEKQEKNTETNFKRESKSQKPKEFKVNLISTSTPKKNSQINTLGNNTTNVYTKRSNDNEIGKKEKHKLKEMILKSHKVLSINKNKEVESIKSKKINTHAQSLDSNSSKRILETNFDSNKKIINSNEKPSLEKNEVIKNEFENKSKRVTDNRVIYKYLEKQFLKKNLKYDSAENNKNLNNLKNRDKNNFNPNFKEAETIKIIRKEGDKNLLRVECTEENLITDRDENKDLKENIEEKNIEKNMKNIKKLKKILKKAKEDKLK